MTKLLAFKLIVCLIQLVQSNSPQSGKTATAPGWQELEVALQGSDVLAQPKLFCRDLEFLMGLVNAIRREFACVLGQHTAPR
jgi:hypothetical protein